mgnify:CR=1 FL=1
MEQKLIVVIMGPGKKHFAEMCLESVKNADKILYWANNKDWILKTEKDNIIYHLSNFFNFFDNGWDKNDKATNGKCRQRYLEHLKKNYPSDWCLVLDEDEILEEGGIEKIKKFIFEREPGVYNVKMRHFVGDLGHEDNTHQTHVVPCRLFKISEAIKYPEHSHPILEGELKGACLDTTIWHLGHLPVEYLDYILKRYKQHKKDSIIHNQQFLEQWKYSHLLGKYPIREINPLELPQQICDRYEIDKDIFYHSRYQLELKNAIMVKQWYDYFKPESILDLGCGRGCYLYFWKWFCNDCIGMEISEWARHNAFTLGIGKGDVSDENNYVNTDLITAIDVLEHLTDEELKMTLENMSKYGKRFLFSIPFEGDPNLQADNTHKQFISKEGWIKLIESYGIKISDTPKEWLFSHQLLIGEKLK